MGGVEELGVRVRAEIGGWEVRSSMGHGGSMVVWEDEDGHRIK